ncbi:MAG: hypothetical protein MZU95_09745 [Desulfomicrobium escambiense]|nr:hypothetical protein [Desulfomicrobium escambiense]
MGREKTMDGARACIEEGLRAGHYLISQLDHFPSKPVYVFLRYPAPCPVPILSNAKE